MFEYDYRKDTNVGRVCLEMSLKPFKQLDNEFIENVCRDMFDKWRDLLLYATSCSIMFWTSDGSEILDYSGNLADEFEWCRYIGIGNPRHDATPENTDINRLHVTPIFYTENPPVFHYSDLKNIIAILKRVGKEMTGFDIQVGETFDPGPEFAYSVFKYVRHPELAQGDIMGSKQWIHCASRLHADERHYAAYPNGVPEDTHFGEFLGKQFIHLKNDVGFDYIWLSNGFGYSLNSWEWTGQLFDGNNYKFENAKNVRDSITEFWTYFSKEIGDTIVETRGSNLSTGMDIAAHGCPIDEIYKYNMVSPPNSPWAALDDRFGLELCGFMSHIATLPKNGFPFRYYSHDPWWYNSPWFDRYGRSPHDVFLPLALARIDENGKVTKPNGISFLSVDDSFGDIPRRGAIEMTPPILEAFDDYSDSPGLVTWVYPFEYYCQLGLKNGELSRLMMDDWLIESAIDYGMPINTVISDTNFEQAPIEIFKDTVLLFPVPNKNSNLERVLNKAIASNCKIILFGDTRYASEELRELLGVCISKEESGEFTIETNLVSDIYENGKVSTTLIHDPIVSGGGICEQSNGKSQVLASVKSKTNNETYAYATFNKNIFWIRGSFPHERKSGGHLPPLRSQEKAFAPASLFRAALSFFNYSLYFKCFNVNDKLPLILNSRKENALYFTGFSKDSTTQVCMSYPDGAPCPSNTEFVIENSVGTYETQKCWHKLCRTYIKQEARTKIICRDNDPIHPFYGDKKIEISGLVNAEVTFYAPTNYKVYMVQNTQFAWHDTGITVENLGNSKYRVKNVNGILHISWIDENKPDNLYQKLKFMDNKVTY